MSFLPAQPWEYNLSLSSHADATRLRVGATARPAGRGSTATLRAPPGSLAPSARRPAGAKTEAAVTTSPVRERARRGVGDRLQCTTIFFLQASATSARAATEAGTASCRASAASTGSGARTAATASTPTRRDAIRPLGSASARTAGEVRTKCAIIRTYSRAMMRAVFG